MRIEDFPQYVQSWLAAEYFGLTTTQLRDRIRYYNKHHRKKIRREHGLVCLEDLLLLFRSADPSRNRRR